MVLKLGNAVAFEACTNLMADTSELVRTHRSAFVASAIFPKVASGSRVTFTLRHLSACVTSAQLKTEKLLTVLQLHATAGSCRA